MLTYRFTIFGPPRTKKTSNQIVVVKGRRLVMPSKQWQRWLCDATVIGSPNPPLPIRAPVNCRALFYRDKNLGDAVGFYQGLADFLEKRGYLENDRLIVSWNGSRLLIDRQMPRVEVELTVVSTHHREVFRAIEGA